MRIDDAVLRVQSAYPRIYLACHTRHQTSRVTGEELSIRDASLLAHLDETHPVRQADLGRHLGIAKSTLSEALGWLEQRGLIHRRPDETDPRGALVSRTPAGSAAMSKSSVLETERLVHLLEALGDDDRARAVAGLELLAAAALRIPKEEQ